MMLHDKRVIVVGLGRSGVAAARLCQSEGASVIGTDSAPPERLSDAARALGIPILSGGLETAGLEQADLVVLSPGVPWQEPLAAAKRAGVSIIGEVELAARRISAPIVAVGGTNGKSTTTTLIGQLLKNDGRRVFVGGNLGTPASEAVGAELDVVVLEVSSFQLERAPTFRPRVSILLNVTHDHLDRYPSFADYAGAKGNAFVNQTPDDTAVVPFGDAICAEQAARGRAKLVRFGAQGEYGIEDDVVVERATGARFALGATRLVGRHNFENAAAAIASVRALDVEPDRVVTGLEAFEPLPHRMALAGRVGGIPFYDDSKATNVGAAVTALLGLREARAVLIAGGRDKLGSYEPLVQALERKGRAVVLLGEARERIAQAIGDRIPFVRVADMDEAVRVAWKLAKSDDAVLLSPACSSFDMFRSYAERGDVFTRSVAALAAENSEGSR